MLEHIRRKTSAAVDRGVMQPMTLHQSLALLMPKEHGAWGMLLTVLLLPQFAFDLNATAGTLAGAVAILFLAKRPMETALHPNSRSPERTAALRWLAILVPIGVTAPLVSLFRTAAFTVPLVTVGIATTAMVAAGTVLELPGRWRGSFLVRSLSMVGVVLLVPLQVLASGQEAHSGWILATVIFSFFLCTALRVRSRLRGRRSRLIRPFGSIGTVLLVAMIGGFGVASDLLPKYTFVALLPGAIHTLRTLGYPPSRLNTGKLGLQEIVHTCVFNLATAIIYAIS